MRLQKLWLLLVVVLVATTASAQKFTLSGTIRDASDGEDLPLANIIVTNLSGVGTNSNNYGFYSLTLEKGAYTVAYQYIGYETITKYFDMIADTLLDIDLFVDVDCCVGGGRPSPYLHWCRCSCDHHPNLLVGDHVTPLDPCRRRHHYYY